VIFETIEPYPRHFDLKNATPNTFELPFILEKFRGGDGLHTGLEALCRIGIGANEIL
jgi:hypothetical protein